MKPLTEWLEETEWVNEPEPDWCEGWEISAMHHPGEPTQDDIDRALASWNRVVEAMTALMRRWGEAVVEFNRQMAGLAETFHQPAKTTRDHPLTGHRCPRHGEPLAAGQCRRCQREQTRCHVKHSGRRRG